MTAPLLRRHDPAAPPRAVVLMLHGGTQLSIAPVSERSLTFGRSAWMQNTLRDGFAEAGVATWLLRYAVRGWNDPAAPSPVPDARWALAQVREAHGDVPVVLLGHSMGARTALHVADEESVVGVVALAPWFSPEDPVSGLSGRHLIAAHGRADRITSFAATRALVERARPVAASAEFVDMGPLGHYLLRGRSRWDDVARRGVTSVLDGVRLTSHD